MGCESSPAEESAGAGGAIVEAASQRVTRLGGVLARRRPPAVSPSRNSHGSRVHEFRTAKLRRGSPARPGAIRSAIVVRQRFFGIFWPLFLVAPKRTCNLP